MDWPQMNSCDRANKTVSLTLLILLLYKFLSGFNECLPPQISFSSSVLISFSSDQVTLTSALSIGESSTSLSVFKETSSFTSWGGTSKAFGGELTLASYSDLSTSALTSAFIDLSFSTLLITIAMTLLTCYSVSSLILTSCCFTPFGANVFCEE